MKSKSRIASILKTHCLDSSITGLPSFEISKLNLDSELTLKLPTNLRLGHLVEVIVCELIKSSANYSVLYENVQVVENKKTIGELDFIVEETNTQKLTHVEMAYKFYLYDPNVSSEEINNWIGPNRNDSLKEKLNKLKNKQFPLLYHNGTKSLLENIKIDDVSQALCLLVNLFIPFQHKSNLNPIYNKAIKGYFLDMTTFTALDNPEKQYHIPSKQKWGMDPSENEIWADYAGVEKHINTCLNDKQAPLCWQKHEDTYLVFFIVWWQY